MSLGLNKNSQLLVFLLSLLVSLAANAKDAAIEEGQKEIKEVEEKVESLTKQVEAFAVSGDNFEGDSIWFNTAAYPFSVVNAEKLQGDEYSASAYIPRNARVIVTKHENDDVYVRYKAAHPNNPITRWYQYLRGSSCLEKKDADCPELGGLQVISKELEYKISHEDLIKYGYARSGWEFGALVVPFKYYTGGDRRLATSTTVAPYLGFRGAQHEGMSLTPVISAGLGLVPVNTTTMRNDGSMVESTDTKPALSVSLGLKLTSPKNERFTAGILIGKDFLSNKDRISDPTVDKLWVSIYAGLNIK